MNQNKRLSKSKLKALDERLFDYRSIDRMIAIRRLELETKNVPENVGSRSAIISKEPERMAMKYDEDIELRNLYLFKETVEATLAQLNDELLLIFKYRWLEACYTWDEIADRVHVSRRSIFNKREKILELFANCRGEN